MDTIDGNNTKKVERLHSLVGVPDSGGFGLELGDQRGDPKDLLRGDKSDLVDDEVSRSKRKDRKSSVSPKRDDGEAVLRGSVRR